MKIDFHGKTVLVTGGSRGIGKATAKLFAKSGAKIIVHYNQNLKAAEQTLSQLDGEGHLLAKADLSDPGQTKNMAEAVFSKVDKIDILINNAGIYIEHLLINLPYEEWQDIWEKTISTNLTGPANLSFLLIQHMNNKGGGKIINVTSRGAFRGEPTAPAYGASKAGLNIFGQSFAKALAPNNIFVYTVAPGFVETDMTTDILSGPEGANIKNQSPLKRAATPDEVAKTIVFLASENLEYLTGCIIDINGASYLRT